MALLQAHIPDIEKKNFNINTTIIEKSMTEVVADFIKKFNSDTENTLSFLYPTQSL